ncbi:putative acetyltransferase [Terracoccus luteus]|uniref:Putative acetyltransferase n=1 Tax=Terracoccus luteus TaxID=53356 RepID=A0A495Y3I2_9MICO|nr:GNAT family N-acetyltransferase [Terracoccus luteus]RKT78798.1 putative acetyltransferase [Terracoccus luteus]
MRLERGNLDDPALVALLEGHLTELRALSPPESTHALDVDALRAPGIEVWVVRDGTSLLGCAALAPLTLDGTDAGELKSMRTVASARGRGVGALLVGRLVERARERGLGGLWLETGSEEFFAPARRLYARAGFVECGPFGSYRPDPLSTFMTLPLVGDRSR